MRVLIATTYYYPNMLGGTEQSVKFLAEGLVRKGHEVYVVSADYKGTKRETINGVNVIRFNLKYRSEFIGWKVVRKGFEFRNYLIYNKLESIVKEIKPDVIHTNSLFYLSPVIWKIGHDNHIRVVHTLRDYWGICPKCTLLDKNENVCKDKKMLCRIHQKNYEKFAKYINVVTAPSQFTLNKYNEHGLFKNISNIYVPNAIDIDYDEHRFLVSKRLKREDNIVNFLFIGSLEGFKGINFLIETFKQIELDNIRLTICGVGKLQNQIIESIADDQRIKYLGRVDKEEKEKVFIDSDVMIVPSIWYEPFGRVIIEAYKYGLPVIACKIGGITELLNDKYSIGITPGDKYKLVEAILKLSDRNTIYSYIKELESALDKYDINDQIKEFEKIYLEG